MKKSLLLLFPLILSLFSCGNSGGGKATVGYAFDTSWEIRLYDGDDAKAQELASLIVYYGKLFDSYNSYKGLNNVYDLNASRNLELNDDLIDALKVALEIEEECGGAFSLYLGGLNSLWKENLENGVLPPQDDIDSELAKAKSTHLTIDEEGIASLIGEGQLDLGGIGKGIVLEEIKKRISSWGLNRYIINGGTSSLLLGKNAQNADFSLYLNDYRSFSFSSSEVSLSCSSISMQKYEIDGETYSHFIDLDDGSAKAKATMALLLGEDAARMDAFTTVAMTLEKEEALAFLESKSNKYAYLKDGILITSEELK